MKDTKVIFMGTPDFAVPVLQGLIENTNVIMVVTQPDALVGRKKVLTPSPVKVKALEKAGIDYAPDYFFMSANPAEEEEWFIIGGGSIYQQLLPFCDRVYVTKIYKDHDNVDTYFPNLDKSEEWAPAACGQLLTYNDLTYQFWQYDRIS